MARFQLERGPIPLHHQVFRDLKSALDANEWRPGDRMPTERALAERYGCSLITVRHALGELVREGRIERTRGRGTFVLQPRIDRDIAGAMSFSEEMQRRGLDPATRVVTARIEPAGDAIAGSLSIAADAPVVYLERIRLGSGEPLLLEQARLPAERFPGLLAFDFEHRSLYDILSERYGTRIVRAREAVEPVVLKRREAELLDLPTPHPGAADRWRGVRRRRFGGRGGTQFRAGRSDPLLPGARRRARPLARQHRSDARGGGRCRPPRRRRRGWGRGGTRLNDSVPAVWR